MTILPPPPIRVALIFLVRVGHLSVIDARQATSVLCELTGLAGRRGVRRDRRELEKVGAQDAIDAGGMQVPAALQERSRATSFGVPCFNGIGSA